MEKSDLEKRDKVIENNSGICGRLRIGSRKNIRSTGSFRRSQQELSKENRNRATNFRMKSRRFTDMT